MTKVYITTKTSVDQLAEDVAFSGEAYETVIGFILEIDSHIADSEFTEQLFKAIKKVHKAAQKEDKR